MLSKVSPIPASARNSQSEVWRERTCTVLPFLERSWESGTSGLLASWEDLGRLAPLFCFVSFSPGSQLSGAPPACLTNEGLHFGLSTPRPGADSERKSGESVLSGSSERCGGVANVELVALISEGFTPKRRAGDREPMQEPGFCSQRTPAALLRSLAIQPCAVDRGGGLLEPEEAVVRGLQLAIGGEQNFAVLAVLFPEPETGASVQPTGQRLLGKGNNSRVTAQNQPTPRNCTTFDCASALRRDEARAERLQSGTAIRDWEDKTCLRLWRVPR